jgi:hypothetical protein
MPAIGDQTGRPITVRRPRKKKPPPPRPSQSFTSSPFQRPFAGQTRQGAQKVQRAVRHLPQPVVATPPVIHNPTPRQVQHAAHQIARSITRAVGTSGSNAEKIARRDAIVAQIRTDPRLHRVNRSLTHWQREQAKLIRPDAYRDRAVPGRSDKHARIGVGRLLAPDRPRGPRSRWGTISAPGSSNGGRARTSAAQPSSGPVTAPGSRSATWRATSSRTRACRS